MTAATARINAIARRYAFSARNPSRKLPLPAHADSGMIASSKASAPMNLSAVSTIGSVAR